MCSANNVEKLLEEKEENLRDHSHENLERGRICPHIKLFRRGVEEPESTDLKKIHEQLADRSRLKRRHVPKAVQS
jgi:hypothetical protein